MDFLEGDPARPIIIGSVYNGDHPPPYTSPTQSGIKTRSAPSGTQQDFNEIRFEDKKGEEELYIHAQKVQTTMVEGNQNVTVGADQTVSVAGAENVKVKGGVSYSAASVSMSAGSFSGSYNKDSSISIGGDEKVTTTGAQTISVGKDHKLEVTGESTVKTDGSESHKTGTEFAVEAGEDIVLSAGDAKIRLKKSGEVVISGTKILVEGSGPVKINSTSSTVKVKGSKVRNN